MTAKYRDHYDWVTFGDHPAAILTAAAVARLGMSSIVVPIENAPEATAADESAQLIDFEPSRISGLGRIGQSSGLWRGAIERLTGKRGAEGFWEKVVERKVAREIITPHDRIGVATDSDLFAREFSREWSVESAPLADALKRADQAVGRFGDRWFEAFRLRIENGKSVALSPPRLDDCLGDEFKGAPSPVRAVFRARGGFAGLLCAAFPSVSRARAEGVARAFELPDPWVSVCSERSGAEFRGGMPAFRKAMLEVAAESGAQIVNEEVCRRIDVDSSRGTKLRSFMLSGLPNPILVGAGAYSGSSDQLVDSLRESAAGAIPAVFRAVPSAWRFTLAFTLHREAIPAGIPSCVTVLDNEGPPLELEWASAEDYGLDEPEHVLLFARTPVPFDRATLAIEAQRKLAARIMRVIAGVFPFVEFHVARVSPDFRIAPSGKSGGDEFSRTYGFAAPELIPEKLRIYSPGTSKNSFRTGIDGLFRVGQSSYPEWGGIGALRAAVEGIAWFAHKNGLLGPFTA